MHKHDTTHKHGTTQLSITLAHVTFKMADKVINYARGIITDISSRFSWISEAPASDLQEQLVDIFHPMS